MGEARSPWRALRPVLLASAAAVSWLTLSATASSADTLPDTSSLPGGVTSSVSSVTDRLPHTLPAAPAPASPPPAGLLQPAVAPVAELADHVVSSVPVVNHVVPAGTVSAVSAPLAEAADGTTAAVVRVIVPPVAEALPVLEPVLEPIADLVTGTAPLPVPIPELPALNINELPDAAASAPASDGTEATAGPSAEADAAAGFPGEASAVQSADAAAGLDILAGSSGPTLTQLAVPDMAAGQAGTAHPSPLPAPNPAVPGSGTGSGASSGAPGSAAWLNTFDFGLPLTGAVLASEASEHAPEPVSFDPGSSPD